MGELTPAAGKLSTSGSVRFQISGVVIAYASGSEASSALRGNIHPKQVDTRPQAYRLKLDKGGSAFLLYLGSVH